MKINVSIMMKLILVIVELWEKSWADYLKLIESLIAWKVEVGEWTYRCLNTQMNNGGIKMEELWDWDWVGRVGKNQILSFSLSM